MPGIAKFIVGLEGLFFLACLGILIYLIFRRIEIKKKETFEDRDN
jgi:hypothetical protein